MAEAPSVPSHYRETVRNLHSTWDLEWRPEMQRFALVKRGWFRGRPQAIVQSVCQEDDGSYRPLDQRFIDHIMRQTFRERNGYYEDEAMAKREEQAQEANKRATRNDLEALRDEAETRVRLANRTGRSEVAAHARG